MNQEFVQTLIKHNHKNSMPNSIAVQKFLTELLGTMFPSFNYDNSFPQNPVLLNHKFEILQLELANIIFSLNLDLDFKQISQDFFCKIPSVYDRLLMDATSMYQGDPAATSINEVILAYPGFFAIAVHRLANILQKLNIPIIPRIFSEYAHQKTGVDIHPNAQIGDNFCIDHATGIVIGETTTIGNNVKLYQGVTLGALSVEKGLAKHKRHPTIEDNVTIYANATILGGDTTVGANTIIGGNVWLTSSVPANSIVYHQSNISVRHDKNIE